MLDEARSIIASFCIELHVRVPCSETQQHRVYARAQTYPTPQGTCQRGNLVAPCRLNVSIFDGVLTELELNAALA